jgi:hypothetical protein
MRSVILRVLAVIVGLWLLGAAGVASNGAVAVVLCLIAAVFFIYALLPAIARAAGLGEKAARVVQRVADSDQTAKAPAGEEALNRDMDAPWAVPPPGKRYSIAYGFAIAPPSCAIAGWVLARQTKDFTVVQGVIGGMAAGLAAAFILWVIDRGKKRRQ